MTQQSANSNASHSDAAILVHTDASPDNRCHHQFANGTRCRLLTLYQDSLFCPRRASVLAYISSLELRTLAAIEHELGQDDFCPVILGDEEPAPAADKRS